MTISATTQGLRPGVCTSTSRPSTPFTGQLIFETDTNRLAVWNGTSWVFLADADTPSGLQLVKTQTIGSAVSSVAVTNAFSSEFDNYKITISDGTASTTSDLRLQFGSTTSGYYAGYSRINYSGGTASPTSDNNAANFSGAGFMNTNGLIMNVEVVSPNLAKNTFISGGVGISVTSDRGVVFSGFVNNTTQYTDFTVLTGSGTMTGGTIRVYGYRNS